MTGLLKSDNFLDRRRLFFVYLFLFGNRLEQGAFNHTFSGKRAVKLSSVVWIPLSMWDACLWGSCFSVYKMFKIADGNNILVMYTKYSENIHCKKAYIYTSVNL